MPEPETIFYDGHCGLCHRSVMFVLRRDHDGSKFIFAPLQSQHFIDAVPQGVRTALPNTMLVLRSDGTLLQKSSASLYVLRRVGGFWGVLGTLGAWIPRPLRDAAYDRVAAVRHRVFKKPPQACPVTPAKLRSRFRG